MYIMYMNVIYLVVVLLLDNVIEKAVMKFNIKSNEVFSDVTLLPCYIKSKLFTHFCIDAYGCQLEF